MARLHNYNILCPLIDQKSFLGVAEDKEPKHVIITLGRNVVNKHRLSDQKQVSGWTSKDHITSTVIYDKNQDSYVGVFNRNTIKMWQEDNVNLDKLKKYKFPINILKLLLRDRQPPLIVFENGNCASLPYAIENRKTYESRSLLKDTDEIVDIAWYRLQKMEHVCYIIKSGRKYEILYCPIREELGDLERSKLTRVKISRDNEAEVVGELILSTSYSYKRDKCPCYVYVLWNDSKMTVYNNVTNKWKTLGTVPWMSTCSRVSMSSMGENHLIIFGSNSDQDGAILVAYNYILSIGSCRYPMKMYRENAKLYCFDDNIILEASNHIGMLPFTIEKKRNLSSLLGSHEVIQNETPQIAAWDTPTEPLFKYPPEMTDTVALGITERSACAQVVPALIEKKDSKSLLRVVQEFKDIPESVLALLVEYAVRQVVKEDVNPALNEALQEVDFVGNKDEFDLLDKVFTISFCDALLMPYLRNSLSVEDSLFILRYIVFLLCVSDKDLDADYESRLYDWCTLIMDAFYQQYLLSKNPNVTKTLADVTMHVDSLIQNLFSINDTIAELHKLLCGKTANVNKNEDLFYTIEMMQI